MTRTTRLLLLAAALVALASGVARHSDPAPGARARPEKRTGATALQVVATTQLGGAPSGMVMASGSLWVRWASMGSPASIPPPTRSSRGSGRGESRSPRASARSGRSTSSPTSCSASTRERTGSSIGSQSGACRPESRSATAPSGSPTNSTRPSPESHPRPAGRSRRSSWTGAGSGPTRLSRHPDGVWAVAGDGNIVDRIRPGTSAVDVRIPLRGARALTVALGSVWVGIANSSALLRIRDGGPCGSQFRAIVPADWVPNWPAGLSSGWRCPDASPESGRQAATSPAAGSPPAIT